MTEAFGVSVVFWLAAVAVGVVGVAAVLLASWAFDVIRNWYRDTWQRWTANVADWWYWRRERRAGLDIVGPNIAFQYGDPAEFRRLAFRRDGLRPSVFEWVNGIPPRRRSETRLTVVGGQVVEADTGLAAAGYWEQRRTISYWNRAYFDQIRAELGGG